MTDDTRHGIFTLPVDDMADLASEVDGLTDDQIKTALCYVDAKVTCAENPGDDFATHFSASWAEMLSDEAEDAETDEPQATIAQLCEWFRQGLIFQHTEPRSSFVTGGDST